MSQGVTEPPLTAEEFLSAAWAGEGEVRDLFGRRLRTFTVRFAGHWSERDSAYLMDEALDYGAGLSMARSWHVATDGEGYLLGLEPLQGGRLRMQNREDGFSLEYDRLRHVRGPNVATSSLYMRRGEGGTVRVTGWTRLLGLIPVIRTGGTLRPAAV